jgi:hypothetical protein
MPKVDPNLPNAYVFARNFAKLYGVSERKGVTAFWVSLLPASVQEQWGNQEITDADIIKMAHERGLYGTTPWLEKNASQ